MTIILEYSAAALMCNAIVDSFDNGVAPGYMEIYGGAVPPTLASVPDEPTPLATITFADNVAFEAAADIGGLYARARINTQPVTDPSAVGHASLTATFVRVFDADGNARYQNDDIGTSGTQIVISSLSIPPGTEVSLNTFQMIVPYKG